MQNKIKKFILKSELKTFFARPFINRHKYRHEYNMSYASGNKNIFDIFYSEESINKNILVIDIHGGFFKYMSKIDKTNFYSLFLDNGIDVISLEYSKKDIFLQIYEINKALHFINKNLPFFNHEYKSIFLLANDSSSTLSLIQEIHKHHNLDLMYNDYLISGIILNSPIYDYKIYLKKLKVLNYLKNAFENIDYNKIIEKYDYTSYLDYIECPIFISTSKLDIIKEESSQLYFELSKRNKKVTYVNIDNDNKKNIHNHNIFNMGLKDSMIVNQKILDFILKGEKND